MMSIEAIRQLSTEAAAAAAELGQTPWVYWDEQELDQTRTWPFPFLGDYVPEGWELVERYFVDSSGLGEDDEPALSQSQFRELVRLNLSDGWALLEAGPFQVWVGQYRRVNS